MKLKNLRSAFSQRVNLYYLMEEEKIELIDEDVIINDKLYGLLDCTIHKIYAKVKSNGKPRVCIVLKGEIMNKCKYREKLENKDMYVCTVFLNWWEKDALKDRLFLTEQYCMCELYKGEDK